VRANTEITSASIVCRRPDQVSAEIDDVTAIMSVDSDMYYLLDAIGSAIWSKIENPIRVSDLRDSLVKEFAVEPAECEADVVEFLTAAQARKLLKPIA
jgi:hypothetical protein